MASAGVVPAPQRWELAAETIAIKIRWFGLFVGYALVNLDQPGPHRLALNAILALGALYALADTCFSFRGRVFLGRYPVFITFMEALFIGLLCSYHGGLESSFRFYYFLSLICAAIRYSSFTTYAACGLHCASYLCLYLALPADEQRPATLLLTMVVLFWFTWASNALALLLKHVGEYLGQLNMALEENRLELEARIAERTRELQEAQAHLLHQEKMAAFGLLAAGIAHEVGNPLTSISSLVQMLQRRDCDSYAREKLSLVSGQLQRIQVTLRELVNFSRPTSTERTWFAPSEVVEEALNIAKYYKRVKGRRIEWHLASDLPPCYGVRDQLVQVLLNLVLNAIDATNRGGTIELFVERAGSDLVLTVRDNGCGIAPEHQARLFQPYFTTKKHGTGLGLCVTRRLVQAHGGRVDCESRPGEGTAFRVRLPLRVAEPLALATQEA